MINPWQTVISQYANSPTLLALIDTFNESIDPRALIEVFYKKVWDIDQATDYGLDIWGRIIGIDRSFQIPIGPKYFGFSDARPGVTTWGFGPFYSGQKLRQPYTITDNDAYRRLILAKAATNITDGSIVSVNKILTDLFANRGRVYVREMPPPSWHYFGFAEQKSASGFNQEGSFGDYLRRRTSSMMNVTYVFNFSLEDYEDHIVRYSSAIPRTAGVQVEVEINA